MGYWSYYLLSFLLAYATQNPAAAVLALGFWLCRGFLPDPVVWIRTMGRISRLRAEIAINPSNMMATRDLARLYLERKRPKQAIFLIEKTRERMAESASPARITRRCRAPLPARRRKAEVRGAGGGARAARRSHRHRA
jgi:hypothetical protein